MKIHSRSLNLASSPRDPRVLVKAGRSAVTFHCRNVSCLFLKAFLKYLHVVRVSLHFCYNNNVVFIPGI